MPVGLLQVEGTIEVSQFWPEGRSDADTTKVIVNVAADAIRFRRNDSSPFQPTQIFDNAKVKGRTATAPIRNGKLTIRLQGIDAPELHYQPSPLSPAEKKRAAGRQTAGLSRSHAFLPAIPRRDLDQGAA